MPKKTARLPFLLVSFFLTCSLFGQIPQDQSGTQTHKPSVAELWQQQRQQLMEGRQSPDRQPAAAHLFKAWKAARALRVAQRPAGSTAGSATTPHASNANAWQEVGPLPLLWPWTITSTANSDYHPMSGTVTALAVDLVSDPTGNTVYVGTQKGGLWKSTNALDAKATFTPLTDSLPAASIGSIAIDASTQPATIYAGTGDQDDSSDSYLGVGILKSTDGGSTWSIVSSADNGAHSFLGLSVDRIVIDPANPQHLVAATQATNAKTSLPYPEAGIYDSTDGGATWSLRQQFTNLLGSPSGVTDLVYDPTAKMYYAAVTGTGVYSSPDGDTWTQTSTPMQDGYPPSVVTFRRASLAVRNGTVYLLYCRSNGNTPNAGFGDTGLAQSTDQGKTWTVIASPAAPSSNYPSPLFSSDGTRNQFIAAPANSTGLILGGTYVWATASVNGAGTNWTDLTAAKMVGNGQHAVAVVNANFWFEGTNQGLWATQDGGNTWSNLNSTLGTISLSRILPTDVAAGDFLGVVQGFGLASANNDGTGAWTGNPQYNSSELVEDAANPARIYAGSGIFDLLVSDDGGKTFQPRQFKSPQYEPGSSAALTVMPGRTWELAGASCRIWIGSGYANPLGINWKPVSPDLTTAAATDGCTPWTDPGVLPDSISIIAAAPSDANTMYAVTRNGRLATSANVLADVPAWTTLTAPPLPADGSRTFSALTVSPSNAKTLYLGLTGFGSGHIFKSTDAGVSWTDISGNLPDAPLNSIVIDPEHSGDLYVATDAGVFVATDGGTSDESWQQLGTGLPTGPVLALRLSNTGTRVLAATTYGRGVWTIAPLHNDADFSLQVTPNYVVQAPGQAAQITAAVSAINGYSGTVTLSCSAAGTTCTADPSTIQPGQTAAIHPAASATAGQTVTITATDGAITHTQTAQIDTSGILARPGTLDLLPGQDQMVEMDGINLTGTATIQCGATPPGITCSVLSNTIDPVRAFTGTVDLTAADTVAPGTYTVPITGTMGNQTFTTSITVEVTSFNLLAIPSTTAVTDPSQPAQFTIQVSAGSNASAPVALACDSASGVTCQFNPASLATGSGRTQLTVTNLGALTQPLQFKVIGSAGSESHSIPLTVKQETWNLSTYSQVSYFAPGADQTTIFLDFTAGPDLPYPQFTCSATAPVTCTASPNGSLVIVQLKGLASLPSGTDSYSFQVTASDGFKTQTIPLTVSHQNFLLGTPLLLQQVMKGTDSASFTLTSTPVQNYDKPLQLACSVPDGVTCTATPATIQPGDSATIQVNGLASQPSGDVQIAVTATSGALLQKTGFTVHVADFTLASPAPAQDLASGTDTARFVVQASTAKYMRGAIQLGCGNAAPIQCSFSPANLVTGASSVLTVTGLSKAAASNDQITVNVTGTAGPDVHQLALAVNVPDFTGSTGNSGGTGGSSATTQTVTAGQTAQYALSYQSLNGFSGDVTMSCSGAPAYAACTVSPASFTLAKGGTQAVTVSVSTAGQSMLAPVHTTDDTGTSAGLLLMLGLGGLLLAGLPRRRRLAVAGALLLGALLLAGCGGGGGSPAAPPPASTATPKGTSTLTVTARANGVSHATQLTLTVQ